MLRRTTPLAAAMSENYAYVVDLARRLAGGLPSLLDYGCGAGQVVSLARDAGMDAYGVDLFYGGDPHMREAVADAGLLGRWLFELDDGRIPFPDARFDIVASNQVFEHVESLELPVREIERVLKPGGAVILVFPSREVWREGHIGIPFAHRLPKDSLLRYRYVTTLRRLGFGSDTVTTATTREAWVAEALAWIDRWTHYRSRAEIEAALRPRFAIESFAADHMRFRLRRHRLLKPVALLAAASLFDHLLEALCTRLGQQVLVLRKRRPEG